MAGVMSLKELRNHVSRNGFDLSQKVSFTAKVGELLPVQTLEILPGDNINSKIQAFTRTRPVNTAAFTRIREYYDWFFVPTRLLWNRFPTFVSQMTTNPTKAKDLKSSIDVTDTQPYFTRLQLNAYLSGLSSISKPDDKNMFGFKHYDNTVKLLSYLGYGFNSDASANASIDQTLNINMNPFPLLAYQKIYQDYYRDSQWESPSPWSCNLDFIASDKLNLDLNSLITGKFTESNLFTLRYANWNKDYFMGVLPSPQYGLTAIIAPDSGASNLTVLNLRQAEFLQKWKEIAQTGDQDYRDQMEKHFGVKLPPTLSDMCQWLGGSSDSLDISEVVNTNITGDNPSDIAGKGAGVMSGYMNFEAKEHGILMCIYHAIPLLEYASDGISRLCTKTKATDYAIPEFDSVGMQQIPFHELTTSQVDAYTPSTLLLGYAPRYVDYKTQYDRILGSFMNTDISWTAPISQKYLDSIIAAFSSWEAHKFKVNYKFLKVNPSVLDTIFGRAVDSSVQSDQLLITTNFDIKAVRNLDYNGLPY